LFDTVIRVDQELTPSLRTKPILAAALEAKEKQLNKSFPHFDLSSDDIAREIDHGDLSKSVPHHLMALNQPKLSRISSRDSASLDENEIFDEPSIHAAQDTKPLLAAAIKAKEQEHVPPHLRSINQPTMTEAAEIRSLDEDEIFDEQAVGPLPPRPLLSAALRAKEDLDTPAHLRNMNQPRRTTSFDTSSLDNEDIFDDPSPEKPTSKPLLEAAHKAKLALSQAQVLVTLESLLCEYEKPKQEDGESF
jgi:hypothetical protein